MAAMNAPVISATISGLLAASFTTPITTTSRHHAVTSSIAAQVSARVPRRVFVIR